VKRGTVSASGNAAAGTAHAISLTADAETIGVGSERALPGGARQCTRIVVLRPRIGIDEVGRAWEELDSVERDVRIGGVRFEVSRGKGRCLATHANPRTGERDHQIMTTLTHAFGQKRPTFAVSLRVVDAGVIRLGDEVEVAEVLFRALGQTAPNPCIRGASVGCQR
jgi:uncharacterized protein YcbX